MRSARQAAALVALIAVLATATPAAGRSPVATAVSDHALAVAAAPASVTASPAPCLDTQFNVGPVAERWTSTLGWRFKSSTTPSYLDTAAALAVLQRSYKNITQSRNDCGLADNVSATQSYLGTTAAGIGVTKAGRCGSSDGANTIGFGSLPFGTLAVTCVRSIGSRIIEADIRVSNQISWALSLESCLADYMLESVVTHEVGHAYGLRHVGENNHGRLTMSTHIDGLCENGEATLGNGDVKGLRALY